jgi:hypothetical protein
MLNISITSPPALARTVQGKPACWTTPQVGLPFLNGKLIKGIYEKIGYSSQREGKWILYHSL